MCQTAVHLLHFGGGRVVQWSWINFQVRGVLLVWIRVWQGPTETFSVKLGHLLLFLSLVLRFINLQNNSPVFHRTICLLFIEVDKVVKTFLRFLDIFDTGPNYDTLVEKVAFFSVAKLPRHRYECGMA